MADAKAAAEAAVAESDKEVQRERDDYHKLIKGRPTPTQREADLIKAGAPPADKESDGAVVNPVLEPAKIELRNIEARPTPTGGSGGYTTRAIRSR